MTNSRTVRSAILVASFLVMSMVLSIVQTQRAQAAAPCTGIICTGGEVCMSDNSCSAYRLTFAAPTGVSSSSFTTRVTTNSYPVISYQLQGCLGTSTVCGTPTAQPLLWKNYGQINDTADLTVNDLRPSRTYSYSLYGQYTYGTGQTATSTTSKTFTTWPGTIAAPTNTPGTCDGATSRCTRSISWNTAFPGDGTVTYGKNPPSWGLESNTPNPSANITSMDGSVNGDIWAVGWYNGSILHRNPSGVWAPQNSSTTDSFYSVSTADGQHVWIAGRFGKIYSTDNGGLTWNNTATLSTKNILSVLATSSKTVWALDSQSIYFYDGVTWKRKYNDPSAELQQVFTLDNKEVWAVSYGGGIRHTVEGVKDWDSGTPPVWQNVNTAAGDRFLSIASVDGKILWAGGNNALTGRSILYRSVDGVTWTPITQIPIEVLRFENIQQVDANTFWFTSGNIVGQFNYNNGNPLVTLHNDPATQIGSTYLSVFVESGDSILSAGGQQKISKYSMPITSTRLSAPSLTTNHTLVVPGLESNTQYYYSVSTNGSGLATGISAGTFGGSFTTPVIDTIPPTVTLNTLPAATNSCTVDVSGTATDTAPGAVQSVSVQLDSRPAVTATGTTSWTSSFPCAQVTPGAHTISVRSYDGINYSTSTSGTFIYDNGNPTVTIFGPGSVRTSTVTVNGTANDVLDQVASIEVSANGGPRTPATITPGTSVPWSLAGVPVASGTNTIVVFARDRAGNEGSASTTVIYTPPTFSLIPDIPTQTIDAGTTALFPVTVNAENGFTGTIGFSVAASPNTVSPLLVAYGVTLTDVITAGNTAIILSSTPGAGSGPYTFTLTGTSGSTVVTATMTLTFRTTPDFSLSAIPASRTVVAGANALYDIHVAGTSTYSMPSTGIDFSVGTVPSGVTATFGSLSGTPSAGGDAVVGLTLRTTSTVPSGTTIIVTGDDGEKTHTVSISLTATPPPDFSLSLAPASSSTVAGTPASAAYNLTVTALNGFAKTVHLDLGAPVPDPAITATFSTNDFLPAATGTVVTVNMFADNRVQCPQPGFTSPCTYTVTISGSTTTIPSTVRTTTASLVVAPDVTAPVISGASAVPSHNDVTVSWVSDEASNSRIDVYTDVARTQLVGFKEVLNTYCLVDCHVLTYGPVLRPVTTYYYTVTSVDTAYPSGNSTTVTSDNGTPLSFTTSAAPDLLPPTVIISQPADGTSSVHGTITIAGTATDNNPMSKLTIAMSGPSGSSSLPNTTIVCTSGTSCPFSFNWNSMSPTTPNGSYTLTVTAYSTRGPADSATATSTFTVDNDTTPPTIECISGQTVCQPEATGLTCANGACSVTIHWRTNENSTSEVEYGLAVDCDRSVTRTDGQSITCAYSDAKRYDDRNDNPDGSLPQYTDHSVTLTNLLPTALYHYRVTSCNISNLCTN